MSLMENSQPDEQPKQSPGLPDQSETTFQESAAIESPAITDQAVGEVPGVLIPTTQSETMHVHPHEHIHHDKKWKNYVFQFLMLFLAVFCGFLAEYQLEHIIESQREKQFLRSMLEDLEKDVGLLENEFRATTVQHENLDSLVNIIYQGSFDQPHVNTLYELQRRYLYPIPLRLMSRTETQLKNAGGMRLIKNRKVVEAIINYWSVTELMYGTKESINIHRGRAKDISFSIFSNKYYKHDESWNISPLDTLMGKPQLMTTNSLILTEFANRVSHMNDLIIFNYKQRHVNAQMDNARKLIQLINSEYHFD